MICKKCGNVLSYRIIECPICTRDKQISNLRTELVAVKAERDRLKEALKKYGKHWQGCKLNTRNNNGKCTCGYEQALSGGKETKP